MADLTAAQRRALPGSDYAGPNHTYPIPDIKHARLAIAMVSRFGSPELKARVRAAVRRKFPSIQISG